MKKIFGSIIFTLALVLCSCATTPKAPDDLDIAIRDTSDYLNDNIPAKSKIVILNIQSDYALLSDYIIDELIANAVNDKKFTVVDRAQLEQIRMELQFQVSGEVDDKSALEIGKFFGAQTIVSGAISEFGDRYRMRIRALNVQTAQVQGQYNRNISAGKTITDLKKGGKSTNTVYGARTAAPNSPQGSTTPTASAPAKTETPVYKIGDTGPAGGLIFYDKKNNRNGWRYLEAAPANTERETFMAGDSPYSLNNTNLVGDGFENTQNMMKSIEKKGGGINSTPYYCANLVVNGFNDWYLPSLDEIALMYANLHANNLGNFKQRDYWHSSQHGVVWGTYSFARGESGQHSYAYESDKRLTRACRRF
jgi:TolB-like protein